MSVKRVPVEKLFPGMYLVGLDVSWIDTPFLKHKFMITTAEEIKKIRGSGAKFAEIDLSKSKLPKRKAASPPKPTQPPSAPEPEPAKTTELDKEVVMAKSLRQVAKKSLNNAFSAAQDGGDIDPASLTALVEESALSLTRNGHALLNMFHESPKGASLINHAFNVMSMAVMLGSRFELPEQELLHLGTAAMLMDVGWAKLPLELFENPSMYTDAEFNEVKKHVDYSVELLERNKFDPEVVNLVSMHHERIDGSGYYSNYRGDEIPLGCRLLSLADLYNSKTKGYYDSPSALPVTALRDVFQRSKDGLIDAQLAEMLIRMVGIYPVSSAVLLNTGEKGVVSKVNWRDGRKPIVTIHYNDRGSHMSRPQKVDLFTQLDPQNERAIVSVLDPNKPSDDPYGVLGFEA